MTAPSPPNLDPELPHLPLLRWGDVYRSLDVIPLRDHRDDTTIATISRANNGLIRKDLAQRHAAAASLRRLSCEELIAICHNAATIFQTADLSIDADGTLQSPNSYLRDLAALSGMPEVMGQRNMGKIADALANMGTILAGLTRGLNLAAIDDALTDEYGGWLSYAPLAHAFGAVLPNNSPGVNSLWLPAVALKTPVVLKPGHGEPLTPWRIVQALIQAGCPASAFGFYPADYDGAYTILTECERAVVFGDARSTSRYAANPNISIHGPGYSKIVIGPDAIARWPEHMDVIRRSVADNGGRSCINASTIVVPSGARELADALAAELVDVNPLPLDDPKAPLCAFPSSHIAEAINQAIDRDLQIDGASDRTAALRDGERLVTLAGSRFLRPTVIHCSDPQHPLATREYMFPYVSVVEVSPDQLINYCGRTLALTLISDDPKLKEEALRCSDIQRLNLGSTPTSTVRWDQPHEGNLFDFLYRRRAIHVAAPKPPQTATTPVAAFNTRPRPTQVVFGPGSSARIGEMASGLGLHHVLLVTDPGVVAAGHASTVTDGLIAAGLKVTIFDAVRENPNTEDVARCVASAKGEGDIDGIIGLGGGSSMDTAKGCNFILTNGGRMQDYWGIGKASQPMLPLIAVPTTAGTGSECQSFALIADENTHQKMACGDPKAAARISVLDPELTLSQPPWVAACTGMDAVVHAVETAVTNRRNSQSLLYAWESFRLVSQSYSLVLTQPDDLAARGRMLMGAAYAGMAIENSMLGAAHSMANPLTAHFGVVHGQATGLMLPGVIRFNGTSPEAAESYRQLAERAGWLRPTDSAAYAVAMLAERVEQWLVEASMAVRLSTFGASERNISTLAADAAKQWTAQFNPCPIGADDFAALYTAAL